MDISTFSVSFVSWASFVIASRSGARADAVASIRAYSMRKR